MLCCFTSIFLAISLFKDFTIHWGKMRPDTKLTVLERFAKICKDRGSWAQRWTAEREEHCSCDRENWIDKKIGFFWVACCWSNKFCLSKVGTTGDECFCFPRYDLAFLVMYNDLWFTLLSLKIITILIAILELQQSLSTLCIVEDNPTVWKHNSDALLGKLRCLTFGNYIKIIVEMDMKDAIGSNDGQERFFLSLLFSACSALCWEMWWSGTAVSAYLSVCAIFFFSVFFSSVSGEILFSVSFAFFFQFQEIFPSPFFLLCLPLLAGV